VHRNREKWDVVVVTWNSARHIAACIDSICRAGGRPIVVDNGSSDDTLEIVRSKSGGTATAIATGQNLGYGKAMNLGFKETTGDFVVLSNPDVVFLGNSIRYMIDYLKKNSRTGIVGIQQMFPDGRWQRSYGDLPGIWSGIKDAVGITTVHNHLRRAAWPQKIDRRPKEVAYVDGAVLTVRRDAFLAADGFDEDFYFYAEECDLCARLRSMGWHIRFLPEEQVIHIRGAHSVERDTSDRYVRYHVDTQYLLARRHLPAWKARLYAKLQAAHYKRLMWTYRCLGKAVAPPNDVHRKIQLFADYLRIWQQCARNPNQSVNHQRLSLGAESPKADQ